MTPLTSAETAEASIITTWADVIAKVGFPIVVALVVLYMVWILTQRITHMETVLDGRDKIFAEIEAQEKANHESAIELRNLIEQHNQEMVQRDAQTVTVDTQILRRLDDVFTQQRSQRH